MVEDIASGSLSLYRDKGDENFPQKRAVSPAITSTHIIKTTFWKMRLDANPYIMMYSTPTGDFGAKFVLFRSPPVFAGGTPVR